MDDLSKEELIKKLQKEAQLIHKATKTNIAFLLPVHNYLFVKLKIYRNWSINPMASVIHFSAFLGFIFSILLVILIRYFSKI